MPAASSASALSHAQIVALVDPELVDPISGTLTAHLDGAPLDVESIRGLDARLAGARPPIVPGPAPEIVRLSRPDDSELEVRLHRPVRTGPVPAVLWIHGGGMYLGTAEGDDALCRATADALGVAVAAVDYRLAPEHPHPAPLEDCGLALDWLASADDVLIDARRIAVFGASAGGGLALGLALLARDRGVSAIRYVQAAYPMIDDRHGTGSSRRFADAPVWNERLNRLGWAAYLGGAEADGYAAPARATDLAGLPDHYIDTAEFDMFRDEDVDYAARLWAAGVRCELHVERGTVHGWEGIAPEARVSIATWARRRAALARALA